MTLSQLRKTLRLIIRHERKGEWDAARTLHADTFLPALTLAAVNMQTTPDHVRRML